MKKVFSFWKNASVAAKASPTSGAKACPTSGAKASPTSGAKACPTSGAKACPTSGAKASPTSGAKACPTSGAKASPTSGAKACPTSGAKASPTSETKACPTSEAKVSPTSETKACPTSEAKVCPTSETKACPTSEAKVCPTSETKVCPTSEAKVSPTSETKVCPTSGVMVTSSSGATLSPTSGAMVNYTVQGFSGIKRRKPCILEENLYMIHKAARDDDLWRMELILFLGISDVNERDKISRTALHVACAYGHARMVRLLIQRRCQINLCDIENKSALIQALQYQNTNCANVLLDYGANPNIIDIEGNTALHYAVRGHNIAIVNRLLSRKVNMEERNKNGLTPLALAKLINNDKMVELLISRGAKQDQTKSKEELTSEEKGPQKSESCTPVIDLQKTRKEAWTKANSMTVIGVSKEDSLSSKQQLTSEYKKEKKPKKSESLTPVIDLQKPQKGAWTETNSMIVIDVSSEDSLSSKEPLTSKYKEERGPQKSEGRTPVADISEEDSLSSKQQITLKCKEERRPQKSESSTPVIDVSSEDSLSSKEPLTSKYKEERGPQKSEGRTPVADISEEESLSSKQQITLKCKEERRPQKSESSTPVIDVSSEDSLSSKEPLTSKYKEERGLQKSEGRTPVADISEEESLSSKQQITLKCKEERRPQKSESSTPVIDVSSEDSLSSEEPLTSKYKEERGPQKSEGRTPVADISEEDSLSSKQQITLKCKEERRPQKSESSTPVIDVSSEDSLSSKEPLTSKYKEERGPQKSEGRTPVADISEEDSLSSKQQITLKCKEERRPQKSESSTPAPQRTQKQARTETKSSTVIDVSEEDSLSRLCSKFGIDDSRPTSHNEDLKHKVISETRTPTAKTSKNQSKHIHLPPLHLEKMSQESQINRACDKEDTSAYSGHPSVHKDEEMCIKQGTLEQRKNLQLSKDESKQKSYEFSVKFKTTDCPEEEPLHNSKEGASLRQMPSNLTNKMLDCEGKDAFGKSVSAALQTFPEREETTFKILSPSHADPVSPEDSPWSSSSELCLREKELHSENDQKPNAEHVLNKNESFYNETKNNKVRTPVVTSRVKKDQEFSMQMTKNMNPNTMDWKLDIGPTPRSRDPKSHLELQHPCCNETKLISEIKSHNMPAVTNTITETKPNQDLSQKPLCADNCNANYCKRMDSKLKDKSSSALHNDRTPGVNETEEVQPDIQTLKDVTDMLNVERLALKKEKAQLQKEVEEEEKKQKSSKRKVSGNLSNAADDDSDAWSQQSKVEQTDKQQLPLMENEDSDRFTLREEKKKRRKSNLLCEKYGVQLRKKEEHSIKEVEMNPQLETIIRPQDITLVITEENEAVEEHNYTERQLSEEQNASILQDGILNKYFCKPKVSESSEKEKRLLHENRMLWDEIAKLRLEIDTVKNQTQEMGKKYIEDIAIGKEKNDHLQKTIREIIFQHNAQLEVLRAELIRLNSKLENEQQNRRRLEAKVESYQCRLATAVQDHEHCQTSKRDLQLAFQRSQDEWFSLWDKMNFDMSNLKHNNEILSQRLCEVESKNNSLEVELHHTRDALKERTLVLEGVERDLSQKQRQTEETEHVNQKEQGKMDKDIGKQESLEERLSHLQSEIMLIRQQLDRAPNKADREEKTVINIQDQVLDIIKVFDHENENYVLMLHEIIKELFDEWHHFKERIYQYENDNGERVAVMRQYQQELADTKKKLSTVEGFLEIESRHHMHLEDKKQDFKKELNQSRSQNDDLIGKLPPSSSNEGKTPHQELTVDALLKEYKELKAEKKKWKQMVVNLRTHKEMHMAEDCEVEKYKLRIEESAKDVADQVTQLDLYLQTQSIKKSQSR